MASLRAFFAKAAPPAGRRHAVKPNRRGTKAVSGTAAGCQTAAGSPRIVSAQVGEPVAELPVLLFHARPPPAGPSPR
jgi:hypothetical protein